MISKPGISIEIILNVFKSLIVSLILLQFLLWQQHYFCLFELATSVNLVWCQVCTFYCPFRKKRYTILPEGTTVADSPGLTGTWASTNKALTDLIIFRKSPGITNLCILKTYKI